MTPSWGEVIVSTKPIWKRVFVCIFLSFGLFMCSPQPTQYIFHTPVARYSLYVLKVPLNTKQTNKPWDRAMAEPLWTRYTPHVLSNHTLSSSSSSSVVFCCTTGFWHLSLCLHTSLSSAAHLSATKPQNLSNRVAFEFYFTLLLVYLSFCLQ